MPDVPGWDTNVCVTSYITFAHVPVLLFVLLSRGHGVGVEVVLVVLRGRLERSLVRWTNQSIDNSC